MSTKLTWAERDELWRAEHFEDEIEIYERILNERLAQAVPDCSASVSWGRCGVAEALS